MREPISPPPSARARQIELAEALRDTNSHSTFRGTGHARGKSHNQTDTLGCGRSRGVSNYIKLRSTPGRDSGMWEGWLSPSPAPGRCSSFRIERKRAELAAEHAILSQWRREPPLEARSSRPSPSQHPRRRRLQRCSRFRRRPRHLIGDFWSDQDIARVTLSICLGSASASAQLWPFRRQEQFGSRACVNLPALGKAP